MKHLLELRTTISPTPYFFRRIHYLAASLQDLGDGLGEHEIVVSVGGEAPRENLFRTQPWSNRYPILWRWVDPEAYARLGYQATNRDRAWHMARARFVMIVDADVIFMDDFSELLGEIAARPAVCGVMANKSPFLTSPDPAGSPRPRRSDRGWWRLLAQSFDIPDLPAEHGYAGANVSYVKEGLRERMGEPAPAYFNGGMVIGPAEMIEEMCALYPAAEDAVDRVLTSYFRPQLARTLAIYKAQLPYRLLPQRYNFPNCPLFDQAYPLELERIRMLHYLRTDIVHRDRDFQDAESVSRLLRRTDLTGSNERLRRRVAGLHARVAAEETASEPQIEPRPAAVI